jgi:hypothetical protein
LEVLEAAAWISLRAHRRRDLLKDSVEREAAAPFDGDDGHDGDDQQ